MDKEDDILMHVLAHLQTTPPPCPACCCHSRSEFRYILGEAEETFTGDPCLLPATDDPDRSYAWGE